MAGPEDNNMFSLRSNVYTFNEAIEEQKRRDKFPTTRNNQIKWVDVKTGKRVYIGYSS